MGGIGLFLLGMIVMTNGLHALAGNVMRTALMRFTSSPLTGAMTGAVSTAVLQSSSATTVAAIGFVGAGLLSFSTSLGIIFGANIGTTITGWLVVLLGFKLQIGMLAMPFVFIGAILRLLSTGKLADIGYALAGFGLIFVGISEMQQGMAGMQTIVTPDSFPDDTLVGRLQLVLMGVVVTIITQSSSAGVATALTALFTGTINFEQAAALVIGMDIGTTVTAAMATIGGKVDARRTGYSHVIYNLFTGTGALILITPYVYTWEHLSPNYLYQNAEIALVAFHTLFNTLGVIVILPFTKRFAKFIAALVVEKKTTYTKKLDDGLLKQPELALTALQETVQKEFKTLLYHTYHILSTEKKGKKTDLAKLQLALDQTHAYLDRIQLPSTEGAEWQRLLAISHAMDHMQRLHERCEEDEDRAVTARQTSELITHHEILTATVSDLIELIKSDKWIEGAHVAEIAALEMNKLVEPLREMIMAKIASNEMDVPDATSRLEAIRWLERVSKHIARITYHFMQALVSVSAGK
jgi:phosphate:Na+ symporter